jgi:hypothetical protein
MNRRTTATLAITASLVVLMSSGAAVAAQAGQVRDDLSPVAGMSVIGLARGHVIVRDDLSPTRLTESFGQAVQPDAQRAWSADARREFHGATAAQHQHAQSSTPWTDEARREFHSDPAVTVDDVQSPSRGSD